MNALIIIDVQNDFLPGGALPVPDGDRIIPVINSVQDKFDLIVATQDWHPQGHVSFASQHAGKKPFDTIEYKGHTETLWPDHCIQGTAGAEFSDQLDMRRAEAIFRKGTDIALDSYSAFYDNHHNKATGLDAYLRGRDVSEVYLCGLAAEICVYYTALDSLGEEFETTIIEDATQALDQANFEKAKEKIRQRKGKILRVEEL